MRRLKIKRQTLWTLLSLLPIVALCGVLVYGYVIRPRLQERDTRGRSRSAQGRDRFRGPGAPGERRAPPTEAEIAAMRERMVERTLEAAQVGEAQKAPVKQALTAKEQARRALMEQFNALRTATQKTGVTDQELAQALEKYRAALAQYREKMEAADAALLKQLPVGAQARCTASGILENGLGGMGMGMMRGRFGGGGPGGGAGGPGAQGGPQGFGGRGTRRGAGTQGGTQTSRGGGAQGGGA